MNYPFPTTKFRARCINVVDGDTCDLEIDAGFHATRTERVRLLGIDTPELHAQDAATRERALAAKSALATMLIEDAISGPWPLLIETAKADAFGRYLARIWRLVGEGLDQCVNDRLVLLGHAVKRG